VSDRHSAPHCFATSSLLTRTSAGKDRTRNVDVPHVQDAVRRQLAVAARPHREVRHRVAAWVLSLPEVAYCLAQNPEKGGRSGGDSGVRPRGGPAVVVNPRREPAGRAPTVRQAAVVHGHALAVAVDPKDQQGDRPMRNLIADVTENVSPRAHGHPCGQRRAGPGRRGRRKEPKDTAP
jgi:hypothetical protein